MATDGHAVLGVTTRHAPAVQYAPVCRDVDPGGHRGVEGGESGKWLRARRKDAEAVRKEGERSQNLCFIIVSYRSIGMKITYLRIGNGGKRLFRYVEESDSENEVEVEEDPPDPINITQRQLVHYALPRQLVHYAPDTYMMIPGFDSLVPVGAIAHPHFPKTLIQDYLRITAFRIYFRRLANRIARRDASVPH